MAERSRIKLPSQKFIGRPINAPNCCGAQDLGQAWVFPGSTNRFCSLGTHGEWLSHRALLLHMGSWAVDPPLAWMAHSLLILGVSRKGLFAGLLRSRMVGSWHTDVPRR